MGLSQRFRQGADLLRPGAAAAADDLEPFLPPATGVGDYLPLMRQTGIITDELATLGSAADVAATPAP